MDRCVPLQRHPAVALTMLVQRAGTLVTRQELQAAIWGDTHVDYEQGLNYCIRQVRSALGDTGRGSSVIETVPRVGYRFLPHVERVSLPPANAAAQLPGRPAPRRVGLAAAAGALALIGLSVFAHQPNPAHHVAAVGVITAIHDLFF